MRLTKTCLLLILLYSTSGLYAQSRTATAIKTLLAQQSAAWNKGDLEGFMKGYWENDSLMFIGKKGITYGWSNTLDNYKKGYPDKQAMGQLEFTIIKVKSLSARYSQVTGKWHLQRTIGDLEGYFTLLLEQIKGRWVIIADHSS